MAKCSITDCTRKASASFEESNINMSVIYWCETRESDLKPGCTWKDGRMLTFEEVNEG